MNEHRQKHIEAQKNNSEFTYALGGAGSDCYPYEIVTKNEKEVTIREMNARLADGEQFGSQNWVITPNPLNETFTLKFNKAKGWVNGNTKFTLTTTPKKYYCYEL